MFAGINIIRSLKELRSYKVKMEIIKNKYLIKVKRVGKFVV